MRVKRGDTVKIIAGKFKGQTGKIVAIKPGKNAVAIEGINIVKRSQKPSVTSPQGGILTLHKPLDASKVALVQAGKKTATSRIGYGFKKDGSKIRVYAQANKKEIDT